MVADYPNIVFGGNNAPELGYEITLTGIDDGNGNLRGGVVNVSAPLVDRYCWETREGITLDTQVDLTTNPLDHTLHCLVEVEICRESGYVTVADDDEDGVYETQYTLDDALNDVAIEMMVADHPNIVFGGNNAPELGYTLEIQAFDDMSGTLHTLEEVVTVTGPLVDLFCWDTREGLTLDTNADLTMNPLDHTIHCLLEVDICRESGYVIVADDDDDGTWETKYILDSGLNEQAIALMLAEYPDVSLGGNAFSSGGAYEGESFLGFTVTLTGLDMGDGYLRH